MIENTSQQTSSSSTVQLSRKLFSAHQHVLKTFYISPKYANTLRVLIQCEPHQVCSYHRAWRTAIRMLAVAESGAFDTVTPKRLILEKEDPILSKSYQYYNDAYLKVFSPNEGPIHDICQRIKYNVAAIKLAYGDDFQPQLALFGIHVPLDMPSIKMNVESCWGDNICDALIKVAVYDREPEATEAIFKDFLTTCKENDTRKKIGSIFMSKMLTNKYASELFDIQLLEWREWILRNGECLKDPTKCDPVTYENINSNLLPSFKNKFFISSMIVPHRLKDFMTIHDFMALEDTRYKEFQTAKAKQDVEEFEKKLKVQENQMKANLEQMNAGKPNFPNMASRVANINTTSKGDIITITDQEYGLFARVTALMDSGIMSIINSGTDQSKILRSLLPSDDQYNRYLAFLQIEGPKIHRMYDAYQKKSFQPVKPAQISIPIKRPGAQLPPQLSKKNNIGNGTQEKPYVAEMFNGVSKGLGKTILEDQEVKTSIRSITMMSKEITALAAEFKEKFNKLCNAFDLESTLVKLTQLIETMISFICTIWALVRCQDVTTQALIITSFVTAHHFVSKFSEGIMLIVKYFKNVMENAESEDPEFKTEGGSQEEDEEQDPKIQKTVFGFVAQTVSHYLDFDIHKHQFKKALDPKVLRNYSTGVRAVKDTVDMMKLFEKAFEWVRVEILGFPPSDVEAKELCAELDRFVQRVSKFLPEDMYKNIMNDGNMAKMVKNELIVGNSFRPRLVKCQLPSNVTSSYFSVMNALNQLHDTVCSKTRLNEGRQPPVSIHFYGKPGQGKSVVAQILTADLYTTIFQKPFVAGNCIYNYNPNSQYWEGYFGQFCTMMDDVFQIDNEEVRTRIGADLIGMINDATVSLNMAAIEGKVGTYFNSHLVVITSNDENIPPNVKIQSDMALSRRFHFEVEVTVKEEFATTNRYKCKGKMTELTELDVVKVRKMYGDQIVPWVYQFKVNGVPMDYKQLKEEVLELYKIKQSSAGSVLKRLEKQSETSTDLFGIDVHNITNHKNPVPDVSSIVEQLIKPKPQNDLIADVDRDIYSVTPRYVTQAKGLIITESDDEEEMTELPEIRRGIPLSQVFETESKMSANQIAIAKKQVDSEYTSDSDDEVDDNGNFYNPYNLVDVTKMLAKSSWKYAKGIWKARDVPEEYKEDVVYHYTCMMNRATFPSTQAPELLPGYEEESLMDVIRRAGYEWTPEELTNKQRIINAVVAFKNIMNNTFANAEGAYSMWWERQSDKTKRAVKILAIAASVAGVVFTISALVKMFSYPTSEAMPTSGDPKTNKPKMVVTKGPVIKKGQRINAAQFYKIQSKDTNAITITQDVVSPNIVQLRWANIKQGTTYSLVHALFTHAKSCITVQHFWKTRPEGFEHIKVMTHDRYYYVPLEEIDWHYAGTDLVIVEFADKRIPQFKDLRKHINMSLDAHMDLSDTCLVKPFEHKLVYGRGHFQLKGQYKDTNTREVIELSEHIVVNLDSSAGDCGLPYIINNPKIERKIIAIHVAGCGTSGLGHLIANIEPEIDEHVTQAGGLTLPEHVSVIEFLPPNMRVHMAHNTQIKKSLIHTPQEEALRTTAPATLAPYWEDGVKKSPAENALKKMARPQRTAEDVPLFMQRMDEIVEAVVAQIPRDVKPIELTIAEAINGKPEWEHVHGESFSTSAGYRSKIDPLRKKFKGKWGDVFCVHCGAHGLCSCENPYYQPTPHFQQELDECERLIEKGEAPDWKFLMCLKDERRPLEKVNTPRVFSADEHSRIICRKRRLGGFMENMRKRPWAWFSAVGLNPHSRQWKMAYKRLTRFGRHTRILAGDFRGWDFSLRVYIQEAVYRVIAKYHENDWTDQQKKNFKVLWWSTYKGRYVFQQYVLEFSGGENPSGDIITIDDNNLANAIVHNFCYIMAFEEIFQKIKAALDYWKEVELSCTGDDHVEAHNNDWYTMSLKAKWMTYLGLEYTTVDKKPIGDIKWYSIEETTYLKRKFVERDGEVFAPLDEDVINEIPFWIKDTHQDPRIATTVNCAAALREMFHYGKQKFEAFRTLYNSKLVLAGCPTMDLYCETFEELMARFREGDGFSEDPHYIAEADTKIREDPDAKNIQVLDNGYIWYGNDEYPWGSELSDEEIARMNREWEEHVFPNIAWDSYLGDWEVIRPRSDSFEEPDRDFEAQSLQQGISEPNTHLESGITSFADEVATVEMPNFGGLVIDSDPYPDQGTAKILSRNFVISEFEWSGTDARGTSTFGDLHFPNDLINKPMIKDVLKNFQYFKADTKIAIRVNSTAFHQGQLLVTWLPCYDNAQYKQYNKFENMFIASSNYSAIVSAGANNTVEFTIPYVTPTLWYDLDKTDDVLGYFGYVKLWVLSPLKLINSASTPHVHVTITASFVNPKVAGLKYVAEMQNEAVTKDAHSTLANIGGVLNDVTDIVSSNPIGALAGTARLAKRLHKFATRTKNISLASNTPTIAKVVNDPQYVSGVENISKLSADPENQVTVNPSLFREKDYDILDNYKLLPSLIDYFSWDDTKNPTELIHSHPIHPKLCGIRTVVEGGKNYHIGDLSHVGNLSTLFKYWNGGLKFSFQFVASKFTTSRVRIVWTDRAPPTTDQFGGNVISEIVDITGDTVYNITVPYLKDRMYLDVKYPGYTLDPENIVFNGYLSIYLINTVTSGGSVADTAIDCNVWMSGAEDFQCYRLNSSFMHGNTDTVNKPIWFGQKQAPPSFKAESESFCHFPRELFEMPFKPIIPAKSIVLDGFCMGEKISRWTDITSRYSTVRYNHSEATLTPNAEYFEDCTRVNSTTSSLAASTIDPVIAMVLGTFRFYRGSIRYKLLPRAYDPVGTIQAMLFDKGENDSDSMWAFNAMTFGDIVTRMPLEFSIPFYHPNMFCETLHYTPESSTSYQAGDNRGFKWIYNANNESVTYTLLAATGDDFTIGIPVAPFGQVFQIDSLLERKPRNKSSNQLDKDASAIGGNQKLFQNRNEKS